MPSYPLALVVFTTVSMWSSMLSWGLLQYRCAPERSHLKGPELSSSSGWGMSSLGPQVSPRPLPPLSPMQVLPDSLDAIPRSSPASVWWVDTYPGRWLSGLSSPSQLSVSVSVCTGGKPSPLAGGTSQCRRVSL